MILHGLLQKARNDANALDYTIRGTDAGAFIVWRMTPGGWKKNAEFYDRHDACDYLLSKLSQEDR